MFQALLVRLSEAFGGFLEKIVGLKTDIGQILKCQMLS